MILQRASVFALVFILTGVQVVANQDFDFVDPGRNNIAWSPTQNFGERPAGVKIDTIVLHHTANTSTEGTAKWFWMKESEVSAHFTVGRGGEIIQHVSTYKRAWHAGRSSDVYGRQNVNDFSVGIEIVNKGDGTQPYTEEQLEAVEHVVAAMIKRHDIIQITSHEYVADPRGRKNDPINFPWERLERFNVPMFYGRKLRDD